MQALRRFADFYRSYDPNAHQGVLRLRQAHTQVSLDAGIYEPASYPFRLLPSILLFLYLLIPPTKSRVVHLLRYPLLVYVAYQSTDTILHCRSASAPIGYAIGALKAVTIVWAFVILICTDARKDYFRIEPDGKSNNANHKRQSAYHWQGLPQTLWHRVDWVFDLFMNNRGPRWSWSISRLTPPPREVQDNLPGSIKFPPPTPDSLVTRGQLAWRLSWRIAMCALGIDLLRPLYMQDPYFWSLGSDVASPFPWPTTSRILFAFLNAYFGVQMLFMSPLLLLAVVLGPRVIGNHAWPWLYHEVNGPFSYVLNKGLAGTWGFWWHQMIRYVAEQPGEYFARKLGPFWRKGSHPGMILRLLAAFAVSGIVHACASYTSNAPDVRPLNTLAFFMLQAFGIAVQRIVCKWSGTKSVTSSLHKSIRQAGNLVFVLLWFRLTGPLVADDMAASGLWLYDLLPVSLVSGFSGRGFMVPQSTIWRWHASDKWWHRGWYMSMERV